jgi:hypothetical protein
VKLIERIAAFRSFLQADLDVRWAAAPKNEAPTDVIFALEHMLSKYDSIFKPFEDAYNSTANSEIMQCLEWYITHEKELSVGFPGRTVTIEKVEGVIGITGSYADPVLAREIVAKNGKQSRVLIQNVE